MTKGKLQSKKPQENRTFTCNYVPNVRLLGIIWEKKKKKEKKQASQHRVELLVHCKRSQIALLSHGYRLLSLWENPVNLAIWAT